MHICFPTKLDSRKKNKQIKKRVGTTKVFFLSIITYCNFFISSDTLEEEDEVKKQKLYNNHQKAGGSKKRHLPLVWIRQKSAAQIRSLVISAKFDIIQLNHAAVLDNVSRGCTMDLDELSVATKHVRFAGTR
jgi:hypothetical protein